MKTKKSVSVQFTCETSITALDSSLHIGQFRAAHERCASGIPEGLSLRMLHDVSALVLDLVWQPEHADNLEGVEDACAQGAHPQRDREDRSSLCHNRACWASEHSKRNYTPESTCAVHWDSIHDIIDLKRSQKHGRTLIDEAANETDGNCFPRSNC